MKKIICSLFALSALAVSAQQPQAGPWLRGENSSSAPTTDYIGYSNTNSPPLIFKTSGTECMKTEMNVLLLKKLEELTILMVQQQKEIDALKSK